MFLLLKLIYGELKKADQFFNRDPRTSHLPLIGSPWPMFAILAVYVLFVKHWGPMLMEKRKPFNVKLLMQIYNVVQVVLNFYCFIVALRATYLQPHFNFSCQEYNPQDMRPTTFQLLHATYIFYITKYLDLLDTLFFVLRKKDNQISFLHVYHHALMIFAVWTYTTLLFGSHYTATGVINSFVHVCMYSYYFLSTMKLPIDLGTWKRRLTQLQILQFCYLSLHFAYPIFNNWCKLEMIFVYAAFTQNVFLLTLFIDFYVRAYLTPAKRRTNLPEVESKKDSVKSSWDTELNRIRSKLD